MISRVKDATNSQVCSKMKSQGTLFSSQKINGGWTFKMELDKLKSGSSII